MASSPGADQPAGRAESEPYLLDRRSVVGYLAQRGVLAAAVDRAAAKVTELGGGVSSVVLLVEVGCDRFVVKQPRRQLLVKDAWFAKQERALTEARALQLTHVLSPAAVPSLVDIDAEAFIMTVSAAPADWRSWKDLLLEGTVDPFVARHLGTVLGGWHRSTSHSPQSQEGLHDLEVFEQLRIEPYHHTVAARHPDLAPQIAGAVASLVAKPALCLVHGDFSPKNILVGDDGIWVIDFEVAHIGNPIFDLAFLVSHLLLKSVHRPAGADAYRECAAQFLECYRNNAGTEFVPAAGDLALQVGCLLLARVDGKSPAEYLTATERERAWRIGSRLLRDPAHPLSTWASPGGPGPQAR